MASRLRFSRSILLACISVLPGRSRGNCYLAHAPISTSVPSRKGVLSRSGGYVLTYGRLPLASGVADTLTTFCGLRPVCTYPKDQGN